MQPFWTTMLWVCLAGSRLQSFSQCFQISGQVTDSKTNEPLAGVTVSGFSKTGDLVSKSISDMRGTYRLNDACKINTFKAELGGHYSLILPIQVSGNKTRAPEFFVPVSLTAVPAQTQDPVYDQRTQQHTELKAGSFTENRFTRVFKVVDAISGNLLPDASICIIRTQSGKREYYKALEGHTRSFSGTDIIALEVKLSGFDDFFGNMILDSRAPASGVYYIRMHRRPVVLAVYGETENGFRLEGQGVSNPLHRHNRQFHFISIAPGTYRLLDTDSPGLTYPIDLSPGIHLLTADATSLQQAMASPDSISLYFRQSKYALTEDSLLKLDSLSAILLKHTKQKVSITGYTDNVGSPKLNQTLSEFRAKVVYNYLILKKINPDQLTWKGIGIRSPAKPNDNEENRKWNRRVVIRFQKP